MKNSVEGFGEAYEYSVCRMRKLEVLREIINEQKQLSFAEVLFSEPCRLEVVKLCPHKWYILRIKLWFHNFAGYTG